MPATPLPRQPAPALSVPLVSGERWTLADRSPDTFTMVIFYRGLHCPVCRSYLKTLTRVRGAYAELGVEVVALSMDSEVRARTSRKEWNLGDLPLGYDLDEATAEAWGLYRSEGIKESEPDLFCEPGLFLVRNDGTLYYAAVNSAPWGRPDLPEFVKKVNFIVENDYPARGEQGDRAGGSEAA